MSDGSLNPVGAQGPPRPPPVEMGEQVEMASPLGTAASPRAATGRDAVDLVERGARIDDPALRGLPDSDEVAERLLRASHLVRDGVARYLHLHPGARRRLGLMTHPQLRRALDEAAARTGLSSRTRSVAGAAIAYLGQELRGRVFATAERRLQRVLRGLDHVAKDPTAARALVELAPPGSHLEGIARDHGVLHHDGTDAEAQAAVRAYRDQLANLRGLLSCQRITAADLPASSLAVHRELGGLPRPGELAGVVLTPPEARARERIETVAARVPPEALPLPLRAYRGLIVHVVDPLVAEAHGAEQRLLREAGL